jgi:hypothetical protein
MANLSYHEHGLPNIVRELSDAFERLKELQGKSKAEYTLTKMLELTSALEATDFRDKVFSLLGLSVRNESAFITPDYQISCGEVYLNVLFSSARISRKLLAPALFDPKAEDGSVADPEMSIEAPPQWVLGFCETPWERLRYFEGELHTG